MKIYRRPASLLEKAFTVFALLMFTGAFLPLLRQSRGIAFDAERGDFSSQALFFGIYLITGWFLLLHFKTSKKTLFKRKLLLFLLLLAVISVIWSDFPMLTLRRSLAMIGTSLFGVYFVVRYNVRQQMLLLGLTLLIVLICSLFLIIFVPKLGITFEGANVSAWRGVFKTKNAFGRIMALSAILSLAFLWASSRNKTLYLGIFMLSLLMVIFARSVTSIFSIVIIIAMFPILNGLRYKWPSKLIIPAIILVLFMVAGATLILFFNYEQVLTAFGKSTNLTGRSGLWLKVYESIQERFWLGYGLSGFWVGDKGPSAIIWRSFSWLPNHAHNGLLDIWLDVGLIGLLTFSFLFIQGLIDSIWWLRTKTDVTVFWPLLFLVYFFTTNLTQSMVLQTNNIFWILFVSTVLNVGVYLLPAKKPAIENTFSTMTSTDLNIVTT